MKFTTRYLLIVYLQFKSEFIDNYLACNDCSLFFIWLLTEIPKSIFDAWLFFHCLISMVLPQTKARKSFEQPISGSIVSEFKRSFKYVASLMELAIKQQWRRLKSVVVIVTSWGVKCQSLLIDYPNHKTTTENHRKFDDLRLCDRGVSAFFVQVYY